MLHILLLILKIIGIILGVLLGIVVLSLILVLFVPIRYRADINRTEGEGEPPVEACIKVTWLLHIINIRLDYAKELRLRARLFIFTVFRLPKKQEKDKKKNTKRKRKNARNRKEPVKKENTPEPGKPAKEDIAKERAQTKQTDKTTEKVSEKETEKQPKISIKERIMKWLAKIYQILKNIWYTIIGICDKIKKIRENIEYYWTVLQSDTFQKSFSLCKEELASVFSYIKPRKFQADLIIGMDDPAATAKILSYYGMLYPLIGGNVNITGDFENKRIEGSIHIKGKIRMFTFIKAAVRIYFSKDIRKLLRLFKKEDA